MMMMRMIQPHWRSTGRGEGLPHPATIHHAQSVSGSSGNKSIEKPSFRRHMAFLYTDFLPTFLPNLIVYLAGGMAVLHFMTFTPKIVSMAARICGLLARRSTKKV